MAKEMTSIHKIILIVLCAIFLNCRDKEINKLDYKLENFNAESVLKYSDCKSNIDSYGLIKSSIEDLVVEAKKRTSENLNRILLIYYSEDGDVIKNYKTVLLIYNNKKSHAITFLNNNKKPLKELRFTDFQIDKLYDYLSKIEVKGTETGYDLMTFDFDPTDIKCQYYYLKYEDGDKIKSLSFLKESTE